jgi:hypothetical protein
MADQYHLHFSDGSEYGPVNRATLDEWYRQGRIPPNALVWPDGAPEWVPIEDVFSEARPRVGEAPRSPTESGEGPLEDLLPTRELPGPGPDAWQSLPPAEDDLPTRDLRRPLPPVQKRPSSPEPPRSVPEPAAGPAPDSLEGVEGVEGLAEGLEGPQSSGSPDSPDSPPSPEDLPPGQEDEGPGSDTQPPDSSRPPQDPQRSGLSGRTRTLLLLGGGVVLVVVLLASLVAVLRPTLARRRAIAAVERYALADRRVGDQNLGFVIDLPPGWVALREDNPFVITRGARLRVAHPALGAFGAVRAEAHPELMGDLDRHVDAVLQEQRPGQPSLQEQGRSDIQLGRGRGRLVRTSWEEGVESIQGVTAAWVDGYEYYWLQAWAPASVGEEFVSAFEDLMRAVAPSGALASQVEEAAERLVVEVPELSPEALRLLIGERMSEGESLEGVPVDALRRVSRGLDALSAAEAEEMGQIYGHVWAPVPEAERRRLARVLERVKADRPVAAADVRALRDVVKAGVVALPPEQRARLQELSGRALEKSLVLP